MKSSTSKPKQTDALSSPIQFLKGVGPKLSKLFEQKEIRTLKDALFFLPRDYQDRSKVSLITEIQAEQTVLLHVRVLKHTFIPIRSRNKSLLDVIVTDKSGGQLSLKWFHYHRESMEKKINELKFFNEPTVLVYGKVSKYSSASRMEIVHPEIDWDIPAEDLVLTTGLVPIYSESEGLHQKTIRKVVEQSFHAAGDSLVDDLPASMLSELTLPNLNDAIYELHHPPRSVKLEDLKAFNTKAHERVILDELFKFEWIIGRRRLNIRKENTTPFKSNKNLFDKFIKTLPFELTGDQQNAIQSIYKDLAESKPMNRLIQGDVGCGKTLVSFAASLPIVSENAQTALIAPTEILVQQHFQNALKYLNGISNVAILVGSTPNKERDVILEKLKQGTIQFLIGTHAILEDDVVFKNLSLVIIDEQHRFGVDQRLKLRAKGQHPHLLSMTATPIPRTLALTYYGDLDVTTIKELPKGRPEITTKLFKNKERDDALELIKSELLKKHQGYIIYPLVEESEKIDLANATQSAEELANGFFKSFKIGLLHGKMKNEEKRQIMERFRNKEIDLLVSTTVIEVGVDVPNATVMMIENAERFGLSQLHQLRGRIGRGTANSLCLLVSNAGSENAYERLKAMKNTRDGFVLAELDLEIRGPGEFLGTRQSGELQFKFADLVRDQSLLITARNYAFAVLKKDPDLLASEHVNLRKYFLQTGALIEQRLQTG